MLDLHLDVHPSTAEKLRRILELSPDQEAFAQSIIAYQVSELKRGILNLRIDLKRFEEKCQLSTEGFYQQFSQGKAVCLPVCSPADSPCALPRTRFARSLSPRRRPGRMWARGQPEFWLRQQKDSASRNVRGDHLIGPKSRRAMPNSRMMARTVPGTRSRAPQSRIEVTAPFAGLCQMR